MYTSHALAGWFQPAGQGSALGGLLHEANANRLKVGVRLVVFVTQKNKRFLKAGVLALECLDCHARRAARRPRSPVQCPFRLVNLQLQP
jgi:hypothetical protein